MNLLLLHINDKLIAFRDAQPNRQTPIFALNSIYLKIIFLCYFYFVVPELLTRIVDKKHLFPDCLLWNRGQIDPNSQIYKESRQNTWTAETECTTNCKKDQNCVGVEYDEKKPHLLL